MTVYLHGEYLNISAFTLPCLLWFNRLRVLFCASSVLSDTDKASNKAKDLAPMSMFRLLGVNEPERFCADDETFVRLENPSALSILNTLLGLVHTDIACVYHCKRDFYMCCLTLTFHPRVPVRIAATNRAQQYRLGVCLCLSNWSVESVRMWECKIGTSPWRKLPSLAAFST